MPPFRRLFSSVARLGASPARVAGERLDKFVEAELATSDAMPTIIVCSHWPRGASSVRAIAICEHTCYLAIAHPGGIGYPEAVHIDAHLRAKLLELEHRVRYLLDYPKERLHTSWTHPASVGIYYRTSGVALLDHVFRVQTKASMYWKCIEQAASLFDFVRTHKPRSLGGRRVAFRGKAYNRA